MRTTTKAIIGAGLMLAATGPAAAATITFTGQITSADPTFVQPRPGNPPTATYGGQYSYDFFDFAVDASGSYQLDLTSTAFDSYLGLYANGFDPTDSLKNVLEYNDDGGGGRSSRIIRNLTAGTRYTAVVTPFYTQAGSYNLSINGAGNIAAGTGAVPEPATWAMMLAGFGMIGAAARYRRRKVAVAY